MCYAKKILKILYFTCEKKTGIKEVLKCANRKIVGKIKRFRLVTKKEI